MTRPKISGELICTNCEYTYQFHDVKEVYSKCPKCNAEHPFTNIENYERYKQVRAREQAEQEQRDKLIAENKSKGIACCPKCGSTSIQAVTKGFGLFRGFIGSGKIENYCLNCGHKWKP